MPDTALAVPTSALASLTLPVALPLDRHPAAVYLARLAPGSRRTMRQALDTIAGLLTSGQADALTLDWAQLRYQHTQAVRAALCERYAAATANKMLSALRGVLAECRRLRLADAADLAEAADLRGVRGTTLPRGRALLAGELGALLAAAAAERAPLGLRDAALVAVLYAGGLRRSEAVGLDVGDWDAEAASLTVRAGKGNKARLVYLAQGAALALADWLAVRGAAAGPLFCPVNKGGRITLRRLSPQAVLGILAALAGRAGVAAFSPHDLRRSCISDLLDAGADISAVQQLAGHANIQTTARYDRRGEAAKRKAAGLLHVPYASRRVQ